MDIDDIIDAIRNSRVRITDHADEEAVDDELTIIRRNIFFRDAW